MRLGCSLSDLLPRQAVTADALFALDMVARSGFAAVELDWRHNRNLWTTLGDRFMEAREAVEDRGLVALNVLPCPMTANEVNDDSACATLLGSDVQRMAENGLNHYVVVGGPRRSLAGDVARQLFDGVLPIVDRLGLALAVRNQLDSRFEQLEDLRELFHTLRGSPLRLSCDVGEFQAAAVNPLHALAEFDTLVDSVVLSDRKGRQPVPLGEGELNLAAVLAKAAAMPSVRWAVIRVEPAIGGESLTRLAEAVAVVRRYLPVS